MKKLNLVTDEFVSLKVKFYYIRVLCLQILYRLLRILRDRIVKLQFALYM